jgi:fatty acid desaturase
MLPEAWCYEHNILHHGHTGELRDPDLIERNAEKLRESKLPTPARYAAMGFLAASWRFFYYAPNTVRAWLGRKAPPADGKEPPGYHRTLWLRCYAAYAGLGFVALPAMFLPLGPWAAFSVWANSLGAEVLTNVHTFCVVGPNHTGDDLYRFDTRPHSTGEAVLRQIVGSTNYATGTETIDFGHLYLNYQIEHHIWPDLPMLRYREVAPKVRALCERHGVPYVQEGVLTRVRKMLEVAVGKTSMRRIERILPRRASPTGEAATSPASSRSPQ